MASPNKKTYRVTVYTTAPRTAENKNLQRLFEGLNLGPEVLEDHFFEFDAGFQVDGEYVLKLVEGIPLARLSSWDCVDGKMSAFRSLDNE